MCTGNLKQRFPICGAKPPFKYLYGSLADLLTINHTEAPRTLASADSNLRVIITDFGGQVLTLDRFLFQYSLDSNCLRLLVGLSFVVVIVIVAFVSSWLRILLQEEYQKTHPILFSGSAIYVIVYSLRAGPGVNNSDLTKHLMNVSVRCKTAPIILVGTHIDAVAGYSKLPLTELRKTFPQVLGLMDKCLIHSARTFYNLDTLHSGPGGVLIRRLLQLERLSSQG